MARVCSKCGTAIGAGIPFCGDCGGAAVEREESAEALASYEAILVEFASDGVLEGWELDELARQREEIGISKATHDRLVQKHQPVAEKLPILLAVDESTLAGFLAGQQGVIRARVRNGGERPVRNVTVRHAVVGETSMREHAVRMMGPGRDEEFTLVVSLDRAGQYTMDTVIRAEDMRGKAQFYRSPPLAFAVGGQKGAGPQSVSVNVDASAMRVAGDPLVNLAGIAAGVGGEAGALGQRKWSELSLRLMTPDEWEKWALTRDANARAKAEAEARAKAAAVPPPAPVREPSKPETQWHAQANGAQVGPMAASELAQRIEARQIDGETLVWSEGMAEWRAIKDVAGWKDLLPKVIVPPPVVVDPRKAKWPKLPPAIPAAEAGRNPRGGEPVIISILPGKFLMGAGADDAEAWDDEKPQHEVTISQGFEIWSVPVTQAQYQAVMKTNPSEFNGPNRPVEQVSWFDAVRYCNALSRAHGLPEAYEIGDGDAPAVKWKGFGSPGWRLPTEAEWEYACRAGTKGPRYGELDDIAWYDENSGDETHDVGGKKPNGWGLYDTLGNVWEWVWDWGAEYVKSAQVDPVGPGAGSFRVGRGGSWFYVARLARAAFRGSSDPSHRINRLGFRPARSLTK